MLPASGNTIKNIAKMAQAGTLCCTAFGTISPISLEAYTSLYLMICDLEKAFAGAFSFSGMSSATSSENVRNMIFVLISEMNSRRLLVTEVINDFLVIGSM